MYIQNSWTYKVDWLCFFSFVSQFLISWLLQESLWLNPQGQKACSNNFHSYWSFCCNHSPICHLLFSTRCRLRTISQFFNQATLNYSNSYNRMAYGPQDTFYLIVLPSLLQSNPKKVEHLYWREEFQEKIIICECLSNYSAVNDILWVHINRQKCSRGWLNHERFIKREGNEDGF